MAQEFYEAAGKGSWLAVVKDCGHQQFLDAGFLLNRAFDLLCRGGRDSRQASPQIPALSHWLAWEKSMLYLQAGMNEVLQEVAQLTKTPLVAWLDHTVRGPKQPCSAAPKEEAQAMVCLILSRVARSNARGGTRIWQLHH